MSATLDDQEFQRSESFRPEIEENKGFRVKLQKSLSTSLNRITTPPTCQKTTKQSKTKEPSTKGDKCSNHVTVVEHFSAPVIGIHGMSSGVHTTRQGGKF